MYRISEWVKEGGHIIRNIVGNRKCIKRRNTEIFGKRRPSVHTNTVRITTQVPTPSPTIPTVPTRDVAFTRHPLPDLEASNMAADLGNLSDEFMADNHRHWDGTLRPLIPFVDVDIRSADGRLANLDEEVIRTDLRFRYILHPDANFRFGFHQGFHWITPSSRPTLANA